MDTVRYQNSTMSGPLLFCHRGALGDQAHLHATVAGTASVACPSMARAWRHGRAEVVVYDPKLGAAYYMAKEIGGRVLDYGVSDKLPSILLSDGHAA